MATMEYYHDWHLKCDVLLLADVFKQFRGSSLKVMHDTQVIILVYQF